MKKILCFIMGVIIGMVATYFLIVNTIKVDIVETQENGCIVRLVILNNWYNYYIEY